MGYQVDFFLAPADGLPGLVTPVSVAATVDWHVRHAFAHRVTRQGASALHATSAEHAFLLDRLVDLVFYPFGVVAPDAPVTFVDATDAWASRRSCVAAEEFIAAQCDPVATRLWRYLFEGRGIGRTDDAFPYVPLDPYTPVGYWTDQEVVLLADALQGRFVIEPITVGPAPDYYAIDAVERALAFARDRAAGIIFWWG